MARALKPMSPETKQQVRALAKVLLDAGFSYKEILQHIRTVVVIEALSRKENSIAGAARVLQISDQALRAVMDTAGLKKVTASILEETAS